MAEPDVNKIAEQYSGILKGIGADLDSDVGYMSYHMNGLVITTNGPKTGAVGQPSFTLLMNDAGEKRRWDRAFLRPDQHGDYSYDLPISNHKGGGNVTFVDGHRRDDRDMHALARSRQWYFCTSPR